MGMLDRECIYTENQVMTGSAVISQNIYDSGVSGGDQSADIGLMRELWLVCSLSIPAASASFTATGVISLEHSPDNTTWTTAVSFTINKTIPGNSGQILGAPLPTNLQRYTRINASLNTNPNGALTAWLALNLQRNIPRKSGFSLD